MQHHINTMLLLLDDNDEAVRLEMTNQILRMGYDVLPQLQEALFEFDFEHTESLYALQDITQKLEFNFYADRLLAWSHNPNDLLEGVWLLNKTFPNAPDIDDINKEIERIKIEVWLDLRYDLTALEKVRILNYVFFNRFSFTGDNDDFFNPNNNLLHKVLRHKKGNPILLSVIYAIVAQRLYIPIFGVNLPQNFVLAYLDIPSLPKPTADSRGKSMEPPPNHDVLFYVNPYSQGTVFGRKHIESFVNNLNMTTHPEFFYPCSNKDIVMRILNNLILSYQKVNKMELAQSYWLLLKRLDEEPLEG